MIRVVRKSDIFDTIISARVEESIHPACVWVLCNVPVGAPTVTGTAHLFIIAYCTDLVKIATKGGLVWVYSVRKPAFSAAQRLVC